MVVVTPTKAAKIVVLREHKHTFADIGNQLGIDERTASRNYKRMLKTNDPYAPRPYKGRPKILTPHKVRRAKRAILSGTARDATDCQRQLFPTLTPQAVRKMLCAIGLPGRVRRKRPYLKRVHVKTRKEWAAAHLDWTDWDWQAVVFSDESKINLFGSDGRQYCRRYPGQQYAPQFVQKEMKHGGGNIMVWGCVTWFGVGRIHRVEGRMNSDQFCSILEDSLLGSLEDHGLRVDNVVFQQDNDSKHTSRKTRRWLDEHNIDRLPWPASSPDMNLIEHVWQLLKRRVRAHQPLPSNLTQLWHVVEEEWYRIPVDEIRALYRSMPRRVEALANAKGWYTKY